MNSPSWSGQSIEEQVKASIQSSLPGAQVEVSSNGNHFDIVVISELFEGKGLLDKQRMVYTAITPFMSGPNAPIHAVDRLKTLTPERS
ncbi:MAG: BolA/IbaG family iron-sulfur metabolism protein [SAR324 cluster bacterium]|nr:BolA/IbaG family iron-sulfur metabolism protein [SAR324 cluster bacterium]